MGKIVYLMGKSSTGKDTIFKRLLADEALGLKRIVPYTTRPVRNGERQGVEYFFVDEACFREMKAQGKVIEDREYHTFHGLWRYFTVDDGQIKPEGRYVMIGTLEGYRLLQAHYGKEKLLPILIDLDDGIRLQRALDREKKQRHPKYEEMCRRFLADSADFDEKKVREAGIDKSFVNDDLEGCLREIRDYIAQRLG